MSYLDKVCEDIATKLEKPIKKIASEIHIDDYDRDELGRIMDEQYYMNLENYGSPENPAHYNKYNGCWEI